ncbi:MAG: hypothetical protein LBD42_02410 [Desulfovibrio sp.]|jgi:hypothetical protein|nr:hypothetical protein [Desulfovibrio sp.]
MGLTTAIYAKKMRLPSPSADLNQTLHMALAFGIAGSDVRCFPEALPGMEMPTHA